MAETKKKPTKKSNVKTSSKTKASSKTAAKAKATKASASKKTPSSKASASSKTTAKKQDKAPRTAVLEINNMQYVVAEGETVATRISPDANSKDIEVNLLALIDGDKFDYGKPYLKQKVEFELGEVVKGKKVTTNIFKAKSRYRRRRGFRPKYVEFTLKAIK